MVVSNTVSKQYHGKFSFHFHDILLCSHLTAIAIAHFLVRSFLPRTLKDPNLLNDVMEPFPPYLLFPCVRIPRYFDNLVHAVARYCVLNILVVFVLAGLRAIKCAAI